eukprot:jgi/Ulvmu1/3936/UM018_0159.1
MLSLAGQLCVLALLAVPTSATVIELVAANYTDYLSGLPQDANCVIEYYASWCPHCRRFMPTYDAVGSHFLDVPEPVVQIARIDCASEGETCRAMEVKGYPTVMLGKPPQFISALHDGLSGSGLFVPEHENGKTVEQIVQDIKEHFNISTVQPGGEAEQGNATDNGVPARPDTKTPEQKQDAVPAPPQPQPIPVPAVQPVPSSGVGVPDGSQSAEGTEEEDEVVEEEDDGSARADLRDIIAATVQTYREMCEADSDLWRQRDSFLSFWSLVRAAHPAQQCRWGAAGLVRKLKAWWPQDAGPGWVPPAEMEAFDICGGPAAAAAGAAGRAPSGQYVSCRGSTPATRGYTCGLWMLLHSLAAGMPERKGPERFMRGLRAFIQDFFRCEECRGHFLEQLNLPEAAIVETRNDAVEWLWRTHNKVNERLAQEEKQDGTGDPKYPKIQFPPDYLCPACRKDDGSWDAAETVKFLLHYYGPHAADVRGEAVTAGAQQQLADSIANNEWKLRAPQRRPRDEDGAAGGGADGGRVPAATVDPQQPEVKEGGVGQAQPQLERPQLVVEEEDVEVGGRSGGGWWKKILWLVGIWFVVSMFCRCRWNRQRRRPPHRGGSLAEVL